MVRLTRAQVREIDRRASEQYHIPSIVLMENAARSVADVDPAAIGDALISGSPRASEIALGDVRPALLPRRDLRA